MFSHFIIFFAAYSSAFAAPLSRRALDLGSCSDPTIKFANGLDGRTEPAFAPNNPASFNHGSALNIGVISSFICGQLQSACKAGQDAINACNSGEQAASKLTGQAAADAFNAAVTGGAPSSGSPPSPPAAATPPPPPAAAPPAASAAVPSAAGSDCAQETVTVTVAAGATPTSTASSSSSPSSDSGSGSCNPGSCNPAPANGNGNSQTPSSSSSSSSVPSSGSNSGSCNPGSCNPAPVNGNLQTFTGNLGGAPPAVTKGGKGFVTDNSDFVNLAAALGRSCDVQHNACANAANSGQGNFSVADCDQQDTQCKAGAN